MKFLRVGQLGAERPVLLGDDGEYYGLSGLTADIDGWFFARDGLAMARAALAAGELPGIDAAGIDGQRIGAPIARPGSVLCIGQNHAAHAAESGAAPPTEPILFYKAPNTVVGPYDDVLIPRGSSRTDWEVELGVVIGRTARYLESHDAALGCIAGFVTSNDVSEREFQLGRPGGQWSKGKSCETFNPLGPGWSPRTNCRIPTRSSCRCRSTARSCSPAIPRT